jgi:hypothetical protein
VQTQFKNYIQNSYFKTSEAGEPTNAGLKHSRGTQRPRSGKSHFLEENDGAVKALAQHMVVRNDNGGGRHRKAGSELWKSLGEDGQAQWKRVAALKAK